MFRAEPEVSGRSLHDCVSFGPMRRLDFKPRFKTGEVSGKISDCGRRLIKRPEERGESLVCGSYVSRGASEC